MPPVEDVSQLAKSKQAAIKLMAESFKILQQAGGELPGREVVARLRTRVSFNEWELEVSPKTGYVRWEAIFSFYTVDSVKAGFLRKNKGTWYLTAKGEKALALGPIKLFEAASAAYRKWEQENKPTKPGPDTTAVETLDKEQFQKANLEAQALGGIREFIAAKNAYEFQDLVAALLRAMGYYTPFVAPRGKDGGIDIVAYQDPLGTTAPRIKVQVKHKPDAAVPVDDIRSLKGVINRDGEVGLFVTSGRFTSDAEYFARGADGAYSIARPE
ncbi:Mrr restriction system protein [Hymenobacter psoromatis]|uniref:restriction endonuclease n=1 Tax=Hymenobacter psoromatis TaxID=1484116 RepID=UPI001CBB2D07|nr:Mrr restriction system protein [Hymenobacter psoromatis]